MFKITNPNKILEQERLIAEVLEKQVKKIMDYQDFIYKSLSLKSDGRH
jgi:hypothetical protein